MWEQLDDLALTDMDILSHTGMQDKTDRVSQAATKLDLTSNTAKTQVMKIHSKTNNSILIHSTTR